MGKAILCKSDCSIFKSIQMILTLPPDLFMKEERISWIFLLLLAFWLVVLRSEKKSGEAILYCFAAKSFRIMKSYLFTWNLVTPFLMKSTIWLAAAKPAFKFASAVWAPIFLGVAK